MTSLLRLSRTAKRHVAMRALTDIVSGIIDDGASAIHRRSEE